MKEEVIQLRSNNPPEVFKAIRVVINNGENKLFGYLRYIRYYYSDYNYREGDILDHKILESIQSIYPESRLYVNMLMLFDKQFDDCLAITKSGIEKTIVTYFVQLLTIDKPVPSEINSFLLRLKLILLTSKENKELNYIPDSIVVNVATEEFPKLIKTIKAV